MLVADYLAPFLTGGGIAAVLVGVIPRLLGEFNRKREGDLKGRVDMFTSVTGALERQLADCRTECARLESRVKEEYARVERELQRERNDRIRERDYLLQQLTETRAQVNELLGILRRQGWKDERKHRRGNGESA